MNHSKSEIVQQMLVDMGHGSLGGSEGEWPIYSTMPPLHNGGRHIKVSGVGDDDDNGVMIEVWSSNISDGYLKSKNIYDSMEDLYGTDIRVVVDMDTYTMRSITRTSLPHMGGRRDIRRWIINLDLEITDQQDEANSQTIGDSQT